MVAAIWMSQLLFETPVYRCSPVGSATGIDVVVSPGTTFTLPLLKALCGLRARAQDSNRTSGWSRLDAAGHRERLNVGSRSNLPSEDGRVERPVFLALLPINTGQIGRIAGNVQRASVVSLCRIRGGGLTTWRQARAYREFRTTLSCVAPII